MNVNVGVCVKEREVKESVRIELVKALRQARFILTERDIARSGFITTKEWGTLSTIIFQYMLLGLGRLADLKCKCKYCC
jgi:hypothetical protein